MKPHCLRGTVGALLLLACNAQANEWRSRRPIEPFQPPATAAPIWTQRNADRSTNAAAPPHETADATLPAFTVITPLPNGPIQPPMTSPITPPTPMSTPAPPVQLPLVPKLTPPILRIMPDAIDPAPQPRSDEPSTPLSPPQAVRVIEAEGQTPITSWEADLIREPTCEVRAAVVWWQRSESDRELITGATPVSEGIFDSGFQPGIELAVTNWLDECRAWEIRYVGIQEWSDRTNLAGGAGTLNTAPPIAINAFTLDAAFSAELHSGEAMLRCRLDDSCPAWMIGARYVQLNEALDATLDDGAVRVYRVRTRNHLFGGQIGVEQALATDAAGAWRIESLAKGGLYFNHADHAASLNGAPLLDSHDGLAFTVEAGLQGECAITRRLSLTVAYQVLWLSDVALAAEQLPVSNFGVGNGIERSGHLLLHGAMVGVIWRR